MGSLSASIQLEALVTKEDGGLPEPGGGGQLVSSRKFLMSPWPTQARQRSEPQKPQKERGKCLVGRASAWAWKSLTLT